MKKRGKGVKIKAFNPYPLFPPLVLPIFPTITLTLSPFPTLNPSLFSTLKPYPLSHPEPLPFCPFATLNPPRANRLKKDLVGKICQMLSDDSFRNYFNYQMNLEEYGHHNKHATK
jgi:hypothetical protein